MSTPIEDNKKKYYVKAMPPNFGLHLRRHQSTNLIDAQKKVVQEEDNLIVVSKWKREI